MISSSQRPLPDNTQHSQQTNIHVPGGIRTHDLSRRAAADLRLKPRGHWDRRIRQVTGLNLVGKLYRLKFVLVFLSLCMQTTIVPVLVKPTSTPYWGVPLHSTSYTFHLPFRLLSRSINKPVKLKQEVRRVEWKAKNRSKSENKNYNGMCLNVLKIKIFFWIVVMRFYVQMHVFFSSSSSSSSDLISLLTLLDNCQERS